MAKSLRSKWRRKCRAVKRERYGVKELAQLKKTLGINDNATQQDVEMSEISEIATVTDAKKMKQTEKSKDPEVESMDEEGKRIYNKKTLRDQFGNYPIWMNKRRISKHKKGRGKNTKATTKQSKRLTRKQKKKTKQGNNGPESE